MRYYASRQCVISCLIQYFIFDILVLGPTNSAYNIWISINLKFFDLLVAALSMNEECPYMQFPLFGIKYLYEFICLLGVKFVDHNLELKLDIQYYPRANCWILLLAQFLKIIDGFCLTYGPFNCPVDLVL